MRRSNGACASAPSELTRLNAELGRAKAEAEEANISKTRFLAAASHDILQPLNAARLYVTSLVERQGGNGGDEAQLVGNVDASLDAVEEIFGALLDISRLDTGAMKPEILSFRIDDLLRQLEVEFAPLAHEKGLRLEFVRSSLAVRSDRRLLRRLLQNLVSNAIKYTPQGARAGRLPAAARQACASTSTTPASASRARSSARSSRNSIGSIRAPKWRAGSGSGCRSSSASRACSTTRSRLASDARPRLAFLGRGAAVAPRGPARAPPSAKHPTSIAASSPADGALPRQRRDDPRRHGCAARRLGLPRAQGARSRHGGRRDRPRQRSRRTGFWSTITSTAATASRPIAELRRRFGAELPAILITADRSPARPRRGARAIGIAGAQQAAQAGGLARAAGAMARAARRGGGVNRKSRGDVSQSRPYRTDRAGDQRRRSG